VTGRHAPGKARAELGAELAAYRRAARSLTAHGCAAIARHARLLLDLTGLSFCDAHGLSAFVKIANHADKTGCRYGFIAPRPVVAKVLRITGLDQRMPVFATIDDAPARSRP
jgi:anti-sigma B factor antagonist